MLAELGLLDIFFSMLWFFIFVLWIMLVFRVFADIFRNHEMSGAAKVGWVIFIVLFIYLGVFVYLIANGKGMAERDMQAMQAQDAAMKDYIRSASSSGSAADELARLADLKEKGVIDDAEFAAMKAKIVG